MHLVVGGQALPLLRRLLHGLAERLGVLHHGLELRVRQHPQQVVQDQNQLGGDHVAVFNLHRRRSVSGRCMHYAGGSSPAAQMNATRRETEILLFSKGVHVTPSYPNLLGCSVSTTKRSTGASASRTICSRLRFQCKTALKPQGKKKL